jgi:spore coat polysaccharide biosynthesis predicted glycosyltransferase SpsG
MPELRVLFRVAAGPRIGYGHLVRCVALGKQLGVTPRVALRGGEHARRVAQSLGCRCLDGGSRALLERTHADVLVIDDPSARLTARWRRAARQLTVPVVGLRDLGFGVGEADLVVDGSVTRAGGSRATSSRLEGPRFAVLDHAVTQARSVRSRRKASPPRVLIALGGGRRHRFACRLAADLATACPGVDVRVAVGFDPPASGNGSRSPVCLVRPRPTLATELATATIAVTGGGVSVYEACHVGVPTVAVAVVPAQRPTVRRFATHGAVVDGGRLGAGVSSVEEKRSRRRIVRAVARLLGDDTERRRLEKQGSGQIDGRGGHRVAAAVRRLARRGVGASTHARARP